MYGLNEGRGHSSKCVQQSIVPTAIDKAALCCIRGRNLASPYLIISSQALILYPAMTFMRHLIAQPYVKEFVPLKFEPVLDSNLSLL